MAFVVEPLEMYYNKEKVALDTKMAKSKIILFGFGGLASLAIAVAAGSARADSLKQRCADFDDTWFMGMSYGFGYCNPPNFKDADVTTAAAVFGAHLEIGRVGELESGETVADIDAKFNKDIYPDYGLTLDTSKNEGNTSQTFYKVSLGNFGTLSTLNRWEDILDYNNNGKSLGQRQNVNIVYRVRQGVCYATLSVRGEGPKASKTYFGILSDKAKEEAERVTEKMKRIAMCDGPASASDNSTPPPAAPDNPDFEAITGNADIIVKSKPTFSTNQDNRNSEVNGFIFTGPDSPSRFNMPDIDVRDAYPAALEKDAKTKEIDPKEIIIETSGSGQSGSLDSLIRSGQNLGPGQNILKPDEAIKFVSVSEDKIEVRAVKKLPAEGSVSEKPLLKLTLPAKVEIPYIRPQGSIEAPDEEQKPMLEKINELKAKGYITQEEYERRRELIMGGYYKGLRSFQMDGWTADSPGAKFEISNSGAIKLQEGAAHFSRPASQTPSSLTVETPMGSATAEKTDFWVAYNPAKEYTLVGIREGKVLLTNAFTGQTAILEPQGNGNSGIALLVRPNSAGNSGGGSALFFWIPWALICVFVLRTFYANYKAAYVKALRLTAGGINILSLGLFFFPWLPETGQSGWELVKTGQGLAMLEFGIIALAAVLCFFASSLANKIGAVLQGGAMVLFIALMIKLMPGTYILNVNLVAPIIASLLLIINFVVVLLLWHQLQLKEKA